MPTPSLLIVPARFKTGKLYSQIPTSGAGDFTVTRNTAATRFGPDGLIASVASGIPRLDYYTSGGTAGCPALLVEPSGTNLLTYSEQFNNADWTKQTGVAVTGNVSGIVAPDGTITADFITSTTNSNTNGIFQAGKSVPSGSPNTKSVYLRGVVGGETVRLRDPNQTLGNTLCTLTTTWQRFSLTETQTGGTAGLYITNIPSGGFYAWGAQLETGSVATSYIPTTAGTGSRSADVISVTGAVSGSIGQTEGTIYLEVDAANASTQFFRINIGTSNAIHIYKNASGRYQVRIYPSASWIDLTDTSAKSGFVKIAIAYKSGESALVINGGSPITSATAYSFSAALSSVNFLAGVESVLHARIRAVALYTTRLTNAELQSLTTL